MGSSIQRSSPNEVEDATASGKFNAFIITANDTVGIASAIQKGWDTAKIPTVATLFPIGPDLNTLAPQIRGIVGTVAAPPAYGAKLQADSVVSYCQDKNPCRVVIMIGQLQYPFDKARYDTYLSVLSQHTNITVVATGQGNYDRDTSMKAMQDILQAHPQIEVVLANADQMAIGAMLALQSAGIDPKSLFLVCGCATEEGITLTRSGVCANNIAFYPYTEGQYAVDILVRYHQGETQPVQINSYTVGPFGNPLLTPDILEQHPEFIGQWKG